MTIKKLFSHINPVEILICTILSLITTIATKYIHHEMPFNFDAVGVIQIFGCALIMAAICYVTRLFFTWGANQSKKGPQRKIYKIFDSKYSLLFLAMVILLVWLPSLCALYPGTMINDSWGQLTQVIKLLNGTGTISAHNPVLDTALLSLIVLPIVRVFGNWHLGFFIYTLLQAVCTSLVFSTSIIYMKKYFGQSNQVSLIFLLLYCLFPVFVSSVQTISKDAVAAWIYLLFVICLIEMLRTEGAILKTARYFRLFIGVFILCVLTKKTNIYVILVSLAILACFQKKNRKPVISMIGILFALYFVVLPVIRYTFSIEPSGPQEMLSLPFQQTAVYVIEYGDEITEEEQEVISKVLEYNALGTKYNPVDADPIKGYRPRGVRSDYLKYLSVWAKQGIKHPDAYIRATLSHLAGWFSFYIYKPLTTMEWHTQLHEPYFPKDVWMKPVVCSRAQKTFDTVYEYLFRLPIIGKVLSYAAYTTLLPVFAICTLIRQKSLYKRRYLLAFVPLVLSVIIGCYLAPLSIHFEGVRYLYPVVYTIPTYLMLCISMSGN